MAQKRKPDRFEDEPFIKQVHLDWNLVDNPKRYPFCLPIIASFQPFALHPRLTFLVGENGSGKSTLLEAIAVAAGMNAEGGSRNFQFKTTNESHPLAEAIRLTRGLRRPRSDYFYRAESFYNVATEIDALELDPYGGISLHRVSHGEGFMALVENRLGEDGLYLFDEPEAALSPQRQLAFLIHVHRMVTQQRSQLIIATHSPILMAYPDAWIYGLEGDQLVRQNYEDTEHFRITQAFLLNPNRILSKLFNI